MTRPERTAQAELADIVPIDTCDLRFSAQGWPWAERHGPQIKRFWARAVAEKPALFNGPVIMMRDSRIDGAVYAGSVFEADFATFLYWKDKGLPQETDARNVFGCAVVQSVDGHLLFGRMAPHTAGAGRVYPMAGTPDRDDIRDGVLDVEGSIARELKEETGLDAADASREPGYLLIEDGGMAAICAVLRFDATSRELKQRMMLHIDTSDMAELDEIVVFRRAAYHVHHRMPGFARTLVQSLLD